MEGLIPPAEAIERVARHQARMAKCVFSGRPATPPSLVSATLDRDDVDLARQWIEMRRHWYESEPVERFERAFTAWNGSRVAYAYMGGRVALSAAIHGLNLRPGDEVVVPGFTCIVVPNAFRYADVNVVYADIELDTYGPDVESVYRAITPNTKAILIHHLFGLVCRDYEALLDLARRRGLKVIEDCAHATGAVYRGRRVGNAGHVAFYSSEASKVFNTIQGGLVTTNDDETAHRLAEHYRNTRAASMQRITLLLRNVEIHYYRHKHPLRWLLGDFYRLRHAGKELISTTPEEERGIKPAHYDCRMPAPIAALGLNQLEKLERYQAERARGAAYWDGWREHAGLPRPLVLPDSTPAWLRYPVRVAPEKKADLTWAERELGVSPGVWFVSHLHPAPIRVKNCPNAERAIVTCINLPTILDEDWYERA